MFCEHRAIRTVLEFHGFDGRASSSQCIFWFLRFGKKKKAMIFFSNGGFFLEGGFDELSTPAEKQSYYVSWLSLEIM